jgi:tripartite-type tricarboxylate transporter receptor subunit TctC
MEPSMTFIGLCVAALLMIFAPNASAESYPSRSITIVVPFAAGGPTDVLARIAAEIVAKDMGKAVIVENVTGASGRIAATRVAKAAPDGYTLLMGNVTTHSAVQGLLKSPPYDPIKDFEPIGIVASGPVVLVSRKSLPIVDMASFVKYVRQNHAKMNFGSSGVGSTSHIACSMLLKLLEVEVQHVTYRGASAAMADLLANQIDFVCDLPVTTRPLAEAGEVRALVVADSRRTSLLPEVPSAPEAGLPAFSANAWNGLFAPKGTPGFIVAKLNAALVSAFDNPAVAERIRTVGGELPSEKQRTSEGFSQYLREDVARWNDAVRSANITLE